MIQASSKMKKNIFLCQVAFKGMPSDASAQSPAGNLAQLGIISAFKKIKGYHLNVFSYPPNRNWPNGKMFQYKFGCCINDGVKIFYPGYISLPVLREFFVNFFAIIFLLLKARKNDNVWLYNMDIPSVMPVLVLSKILRFKVFVFAYDIHIPGQTVPNTVRWRLRKLKYKIGLKFSTGVVAITRALAKDFNVLDKSIICHGGVDESIIGINKFDLKKDMKKFVFAGRLENDNSICEIIDAFLMLDDQNAYLTIIGDGPLKSYVENACLQNSRINYMGKVAHSVVIREYQSAYAILCIRKYKSIETPYLFPSKLLEAISTGAIVLSTPIDFTVGDLNSISLVLNGDSLNDVLNGYRNALQIEVSVAEKMREMALLTAKERLLWSSYTDDFVKLSVSEIK